MPILYRCSCGAEYLDIYSEVQSSDPADLINSPFGGRYCGPNLPRRRISLYRAIALSFFTSKNATTADLFTGYYRFINACKYPQLLMSPFTAKILIKTIFICVFFSLFLFHCGEY